MEAIIDQITGAHAAGFPFAAIHMTLALPDICATLQLLLGATAKATVEARYVAWFNGYCAKLVSLITGNDLFALRNGFLHAGKFGYPDMQFSRILFPVRVKNVGLPYV